jgi:hypothetical protein
LGDERLTNDCEAVPDKSSLIHHLWVKNDLDQASPKIIG